MVLFKKSIIYLLLFIAAILFEILFFLIINGVLNSGIITPRGLGWIIFPFIFSVYSYDYFNELMNKENINIQSNELKIKNSLSKKQKFRLSIVISFFWSIAILLISLSFSGQWLLRDGMYLFIIIGLLPPAIFWSYYWIKSAKD